LVASPTSHSNAEEEEEADEGEGEANNEGEEVECLSDVDRPTTFVEVFVLRQKAGIPAYPPIFVLISLSLSLSLSMYIYINMYIYKYPPHLRGKNQECPEPLFKCFCCAMFLLRQKAGISLYLGNKALSY
jgi:hypothetical protein